MILLVIGFVLVMPPWGISGSVAARNIDMGAQGIHRTPGYQEPLPRRTRMWLILTGLAMIGVGIILISVSL